MQVELNKSMLEIEFWCKGIMFKGENIKKRCHDNIITNFDKT